MGRAAEKGRTERLGTKRGLREAAVSGTASAATRAVARLPETLQSDIASQLSYGSASANAENEPCGSSTVSTRATASSPSRASTETRYS